jgi:hypothetical protein
MHTYHQRSGTWEHDGVMIGVGYSGHGPGKNDPSKQDVHNIGPIPSGLCSIGEPCDSRDHGPYVMRLMPDPTNVMHGRSGFLLHGDSVRVPGTASKGCIVMSRGVRVAVWTSGDHQLIVVE